MTDKESPEQLAARLADAATKVTVGARYRHYKGNEYTVLDIAILCEATNEPVIIYRAEYGAQLHFARPVSSWIETVERDGRTVKRFERM